MKQAVFLIPEQECNPDTIQGMTDYLAQVGAEDIPNVESYYATFVHNDSMPVGRYVGFLIADDLFDAATTTLLMMEPKAQIYYTSLATSHFEDFVACANGASNYTTKITAERVYK